MKSRGLEPVSDGVGDSGDSKRSSMNGLLGEMGCLHRMSITSSPVGFFFVHGFVDGRGAGTNFFELAAGGAAGAAGGAAEFVLCAAGPLLAALTSLV